MSLTIVTGFAPSGEHLYGRRMVESLHRYWPSDVDLLCYVEQPTTLPRGEARMLHNVPGWADFFRRWSGDAAANGKLCPERPVGAGKAYDYRWDAVKFARQAFIAADAAERLAEGMMAWFDGDTLSHANVPDGFIADLLGDADVCFLGREPFHPEIGFVGYRLPEALPLLRIWVAYYATGSFRRFKEWHSAYLWREALRQSGIRGRDLTPDGRRNCADVWPHSPLALFTDHLKGNLKKRGRKC